MRRNGFSLIEMAIVLTIIGLLIAAATAGESLIRAAKLQAVISELNAVQTAIYDFQNKFGQLPGDFDNASAVFGCTDGTVPSGCNGHDYGYIADNPGVGYEPARVWQHLGLANMINGTYTAQNNPSDFYTSKYRNGKFVTYYIQPNSSDTVFGRSGWALTLGSYVSTSAYPQGALFTTVDLHSIDLKIDDGIADSGIVYGVDGGGTNPVTNGACSAPASSTGSGINYNLKTTYPACYMVYWME